MNTQHSSGVFKCIEAGLLPKIKIDEERPYDSHDFKGHTDKSLTALSECLALITEMESHVLQDNSRSIVVPAVLLCGENTDASKVAFRILGALRAALGFESVSSLLLAEDSRILRKCLEELRPKLEDWRNFPGAQSAFVWILHHIKFPMLSQHTFQCIEHLVNNVNPTELSWFGRTELIVEALNRNLLAHADNEQLGLIDQAIKCWFALLSKTVDQVWSLSHPFVRLEQQRIEFLSTQKTLPLTISVGNIRVKKPLHKSKKPDGKPNGWDSLAKVFIYKLELATVTGVKVCYAKHLGQLISGLGESVARWTQSLVSLLVHHFEQTTDPELRLHLLRGLLGVLQQEHLSANYSSDIFETLIRLLYSLTSYQQQVEEDASKECLELCNECLIKAVKKFPSQFLELCHEMDELKVNASFNDTIKAAFAQATEKEDIKKEI